MISKRILIFFFLISILIPSRIYSQTPSRAGFIPGNIWYSPDPFEEKDAIKINTIIFNPEANKFSGDVIFFDKDIFLGKKSFIVQARGIENVEINWIATAGEHKIFAKIENAKLLLSNGQYKEIYIAENKTEENILKIEKKEFPNTSIIDNIGTASIESVENIKNAIKEKTPDFVTKTTILTANVIEATRSSMNVVLEKKKEAVQNEIKTLNAESKDGATTVSDLKNKKGDGLMKPFKYIELFFFTIFSFIFGNKPIFYGILFIVAIFFLRYIFRLIFK